MRLGLRAEADVRRTTVEGVVDTGAVSLVIPEEIATQLGAPGLGNENRRLRGRAARRTAHDRRHDRDRNLAMRTEAIVGPVGSEVLIGQLVLEAPELIADCRRRTLAPCHPEGPVLAIH